MNFDDAREDIRRMLIRMEATRKLFELELDASHAEPWRVVDAAEVFAGPSAAELVAAHEATETEAPPSIRGRWWEEQMQKTWPKEFRRKRPWWKPWRAK